MRENNNLLLRCKFCDHKFNINKDDLNQDTHYGKEKGMGFEKVHKFSFEGNCPICKKLINTSVIVTEYPIGSYDSHFIEGNDAIFENKLFIEINDLNVEIKEETCNKFNIFNLIEKKEVKTKYGLLTINNIVISPTKFEQIISELIGDLGILEFIFSTKFEDNQDIINVYKRFLPPRKVLDLDKYIKEAMDKNNNFYSFLAEALLAIILKDLYGYSLAKAVVDVTSTLTDSHTGADGCMYDANRKVFVLGEAKFYQSLYDGMTKIINDFTLSNGFFNKMDSFYRTCTANKDSCSILLKELKEDIYYEHTIDDFLKMHILFAGFVLHNHTGKIEKYLNSMFYDTFDISVNKVVDNINNCFDMKINIDNYEIIMLHLPINNKKNLIKLIMEKAIDKLAKIRGENGGKTKI